MIVQKSEELLAAEEWQERNFWAEQEEAKRRHAYELAKIKQLSATRHKSIQRILTVWAKALSYPICLLVICTIVLTNRPIPPVLIDFLTQAD